VGVGNGDGGGTMSSPHPDDPVGYCVEIAIEASSLANMDLFRYGPHGGGAWECHGRWAAARARGAQKVEPGSCLVQEAGTGNCGSASSLVGCDVLFLKQPVLLVPTPFLRVGPGVDDPV